jgi:hypothetical protein
MWAAALLAGCASQPIDPLAESRNIKTKVGLSSCTTCTKIKLFQSGNLEDQAYSLKSGGHLTSDYRLIATNRKITSTSVQLTPMDPFRARAPRVIADAPGADASRPYRMGLRMSRNYRGIIPVLFLIRADGQHIEVPQVALEDEGSNLQCFNSGCVDSVYYIIPGEEIDRAIEKQVPLKLLLGTQVSREIASKNGFDRSFEKLDAGVTFVVQPTYLKAFVEQVWTNL